MGDYIKVSTLKAILPQFTCRCDVDAADYSQITD